MDELAALRELIARHVGTSLRKAVLDGNVLLGSARTPSERPGGVTGPTVGVVVQGSKRTMLNDQVFTYGPGQFLLVTMALPLMARVVEASPKEPFLVVALTLNPATIATLLLETATTLGSGQDAPPLAVSTAPVELLDAFVRLLRLLDRPEDAPVLAPAIEREIHWRLVTGPQGALVRQIGMAGSRHAQIGRAIERIRATYAEPLRIDALARDVGMSTTSLHRHFRAMTSMSPLQFQKHLRLQAARARLLADPRDVAGAGLAVGYDSPSQFSREYRRLFGMPPGKDVARMQRCSALAMGA